MINQMTPDELRAYKRESYARNQKKTQLARITKGLVNGTRHVSEKTLAKYGLKKMQITRF
jgi:hypothetical protein